MANSTANNLTHISSKNRNFTVNGISPLSFVLSLIVIGFMTACNPAKEEVAPQVDSTPAAVEVVTPYNARIAADAIDVKAFGAVGDGQADDTEAIRKALQKSAGKQLVFQTGTYKVSQSIKFEVSNVEVVGVGVAKIQSTDRMIFNLGNVSNVSFANLTFESVSRDGSTFYYGLVSSNRKTVSNLSFTACTFTAPFCSTTGIKLITDAVGASVANVTVENCTFANLGTMAIEIQNHLHDGVDRFSQIDVRNNTFRNLGLNENAAYHYGMAVSCSGEGNNVTIANNTIINPYDLGIELAGSVKNAQILNNRFSSLTRTNKEANRPTALIAISSSKGDMHENVKIIGNQNTGSADVAYLFLGNMINATVEDNTFNTSWNVQIRNVSNSMFKNNRITSRGTCALTIESTDNNCQNNTFVNSTLTCEEKSVDAIVKFSGAKTSKNVITNSQLNRKSSSSKFMMELNSASGNTLKDCTLANK